MKFSLKIILLATCLYQFSGCAKSAGQNLDQVVEKHMSAIDSVEASTACTDAFEKSLKISSKDFCEALLQRSDGEFAICEGDIRNPRYNLLTEKCKPELMSRLLKLEQLRNEGLSIHAQVFSTQPLGLGFKLPFQTQTRDVSAGGTYPPAGLQNKQVILSFDDGPDPVISRSVLRTLKEVGVKAHFFEVGYHVKASPDTTKLIASEGHSIGNHSWNHPELSKIPYAEAFDQIKKTHEIIFSTLGWVDPFCRFPYGSRTPELDQLLAKNKMISFLWNVDSNDWKKINDDKSVRTNLQVVVETMAQIEKRGNGLILLHDIHQRTAELLPELLKRLYQKGYTVVLLQPSDQSLKTRPPILFDSGGLP